MSVTTYTLTQLAADVDTIKSSVANLNDIMAEVVVAMQKGQQPDSEWTDMVLILLRTYSKRLGFDLSIVTQEGTS